MEERIIEKIRKCLALANNNPSEEEAKAAALQAQKLLAKYNISIADVQDVEQSCAKIEEEVVWFDELVTYGIARAWKYDLADIVSRNFRCKNFFYGKRGVVFYGHATDAKVAAEVYCYLFRNGDKLANKLVYKTIREARKEGLSSNTSGMYNSFVKGYLAGLREALGSQCTALMIVIPEDVKESFEERSKSFKIRDLSMRTTNYNSMAYNEGHKAGKEAMAQRSIEG